MDGRRGEEAGDDFIGNVLETGNTVGPPLRKVEGSTVRGVQDEGVVKNGGLKDLVYVPLGGVCARSSVECVPYYK